MKKKLRDKPTPSELEILHILWSRGPSTVREIHNVLSKQKDVGYTSALKLLQIMTTKGWSRAPRTSAPTYIKPLSLRRQPSSKSWPTCCSACSGARRAN